VCYVVVDVSRHCYAGKSRSPLPREYTESSLLCNQMGGTIMDTEDMTGYEEDCLLAMEEGESAYRQVLEEEG